MSPMISKCRGLFPYLGRITRAEFKNEWISASTPPMRLLNVHTDMFTFKLSWDVSYDFVSNIAPIAITRAAK
jgi:hypothetical protein